MKVYLYYWKTNNINRNFKDVENRCFKNIEELNISKEKNEYEKNNKEHHEIIQRLHKKSKKICNNKKSLKNKLKKIFRLPIKTIDEVNIDIIDEYSSILLETMEFILIKLILNERLSEFEIKELKKSSKIVCSKRKMHNKYFMEEYIEKSITDMEKGCMILYVIEAILGSIMILYNVINLVLRVVL